MDRTFKKKSRNHNQLYCIHAWYKGEYVCAGFGFLKNRQKSSYNALLKTLQQEIINYCNKYISNTLQNFFKNKVVVIGRDKNVRTSNAAERFNSAINRSNLFRKKKCMSKLIKNLRTTELRENIKFLKLKNQEYL
uniref:DDE_Tnp_ISL3 domain-containing protein n=1 Tax=Strongyloides venezuelensis TaxID=75913 RepID=A0A0K0FEE5_STRVS